jgi:hypothetical protein
VLVVCPRASRPDEARFLPRADSTLVPDIGVDGDSHPPGLVQKKSSQRTRAVRAEATTPSARNEEHVDSAVGSFVVQPGLQVAHWLAGGLDEVGVHIEAGEASKHLLSGERPVVPERSDRRISVPFDRRSTSEAVAGRTTVNSPASGVRAFRIGRNGNARGIAIGKRACLQA